MLMKKSFLLAAVAITVLAGCTDDTYLGNETPQLAEGTESAIAMGTGTPNYFTRAGESPESNFINGSDAASLLDNNFVVEGVKTVSGSMNKVFDHYNVNYVAGTANTTTSNLRNWEYVNQDQNIKGTESKLSSASEQSIKYWDYSASQYDFIAVSLGKGTGGSPATYATLTEIKYANLGNDGVTSGETEAVYTLSGDLEELKSAYIADLVTHYKSNSEGQSDYQQIVTPKFRSTAAKIRFGFYETVPGYSIKDVKFFNSSNTEVLASSVPQATLYGGTDFFPVSGGYTLSVYYPTVGYSNISNTDYNKAHVTIGPVGSVEKTSNVTIGALNYQTSRQGTESDVKYLGRTSATATYAVPTSVESGSIPASEGADNIYYELVLPNEDGQDLYLKVDYTLVSVDGSGEEIHVTGATAVVPKVYTKWLSNYAYTYLFKISQNTNGTTGGTTDPAGLYPITFDALVMDYGDGIQETVTTVATPSFTTYSKDVQPTANDEYLVGNNIYVSIEEMDGATFAALSPDNSKLYTATIEDGAAQVINEATVANAVANGVRLVAATGTYEEGKTYYTSDYAKVASPVTGESVADGTFVADAESADADVVAYLVTDANGKTLAVTAEDVLSIEEEIAAGDATDGNAVAGNFAMFTPSAQGIYVFEYTVPAVSYTGYEEYNTANGTELDADEYAALTEAEKIKIPAAKYYKIIKVVPDTNSTPAKTKDEVTDKQFGKRIG